MKDPDFLGRGWGFPIVPSGGGLALASDEQKIRQSILLILGTPKGERVMEPEFGSELHELAFAVNGEAIAGLADRYVRSALAAWEPRIDVDAVTVRQDPANPQKLLVGVDYVIRSKNSQQNVVYPFYLNR